MKLKEMDKLTHHFDTYFGQNDCLVYHNDAMEPHIDVLVYPPNEAYPYWKLATMGASDYRMPAPKQSLGNRNEYIMFLDAEEDLRDSQVGGWYVNKLIEIAMYPFAEKTFMSYGHSIEWPMDEGEEMVGAFLELPMVVENVGILRCKLGLLKTAVCLQAVLLTRKEMDRLLTIGPEAFSEFLYPENGLRHFICQRRRTEKF